MSATAAMALRYVAMQEARQHGAEAKRRNQLCRLLSRPDGRTFLTAALFLTSLIMEAWCAKKQAFSRRTLITASSIVWDLKTFQ